jgi:long-chain acyl-CoA synthetase
MNIARLLDEAADRAGEATALFHGATAAFDYRTLAGRVARLCGNLGRRGVSRGDRVAVFMPNHLAYIEVIYAIFRAGAVAVPVNAKLHERELAFILEESGAKLLFVDDHAENCAGRAASLVRAPIELLNVDTAAYGAALRAPAASMTTREGDEVAWLFFTSGTIGQPKGAMLTHRNLLLMTSSYLTEVHAAGGEDRLLHAAPMSHGSGMYNFAHMACAGAQIVPENHGFDVAEILDISARLKRVSLFAAPTMVHRLLRDLPGGADAAPGLEFIVYGGGPMLLGPLQAALSRLGPRLAQIYGQGECPMTITRLARHLHVQSGEESVYLRRLSSVGTPFHLVDVRIGNASQPFAVDEPGEILVKSPIVMRGYWRRERPDEPLAQPEWLETGDIGYFDAEGYLHLSDRSKDVIISGGSNIYSREVEDVLIAHPAVEEVAVVGLPNAEWGEEVVAVIAHAGQDAPTREDLEAWCGSQIARFKRPRHYVFLKELPRNAYGKIEKKTLKAIVAGTRFQEATGPATHSTRGN